MELLRFSIIIFSSYISMILMLLASERRERRERRALFIHPALSIISLPLILFNASCFSNIFPDIKEDVKRKEIETQKCFQPTNPSSSR